MLQTGDLLKDRYQIEAEIGRGAFGVVYRAYDPVLKRQVAIKVVDRTTGRLSSSEFGRARGRFKQEAAVQSPFSHPNIVQVHDQFDIGDTVYLVMEYVSDPSSAIEGTSLADYIKARGPLPVDEAVDIARQVLAALDTVHQDRRDIVHRDVKPSNILLTRDTDDRLVAKLGDFGIAQVLDGQSGPYMVSLESHPGTRAYMSPEQAETTAHLFPQSDLYSVGCVLYEMLTGKQYFRARHRPSRDDALDPVKPRALRRALARALHPDAQQRYLDTDNRSAAQEMADALEAGLTDRRRPIYLGVAAVVLILVLVWLIPAGFAARDGDPTRPVVNPPATATATERVAETPALVAEVVTPEPTATAQPTSTATTDPTRMPTREPTNTPRPNSTQTPTREPTNTPPPPEPAAGERKLYALPSGGSDVPMRYVSAGPFVMGSAVEAALAACEAVRDDCQAGWFEDEAPSRTVTLDAFWIDETEVTNAQYAACVGDGGCTAPARGGSFTRDAYYGEAAYASYPVIFVDWQQAANYCAWRGARLPTEAEWEKAARGTDGRTYPWGDVFDGSRVNFCDESCSRDWANEAWYDGYADTAPVGAYAAGASPYGTLDMAGNVWEWTADWYLNDYYAEAPDENPLGPTSGSSRVLRGGSWFNDSFNLRAFVRHDYRPSDPDSFVGFRCAQEAHSP